MQNSRKRWEPDPTLPPEEIAAGLANEASGVLAAIREWYDGFRTVRRIRRTMSDKRDLKTILEEALEVKDGDERKASSDS